MKKMLIILLYLISFQISSANEGFSRLNDSTFVEMRIDNQKLTKTRYRWISKSIEYPIYIDRRNGRCYILKTSKKTGNEYKSKINEIASKTIAKELGVDYVEYKK